RRENPLQKTSFSLVGFLIRVRIFFSISRPFSHPFKGHITSCPIDADNADANWIVAVPLEFRYLVDHVGSDAVELLDHGLCEDFHLYADVDGSHLSKRHQMLGHNDGRSIGNALAERAVAPAGASADRDVCDVDNSLLATNGGDKLRGPPQI